MSIEEKLRSLMNANCLPDKAIEEVIVKLKESQPSMKNRWHENWEDYQRIITATLWVLAKGFALEWIDENKPKAFYRSLFI